MTLDEFRKAQIDEQYPDGWTYGRLARELNVSETVARYWCQRIRYPNGVHTMRILKLAGGLIRLYELHPNKTSKQAEFRKARRRLRKGKPRDPKSTDFFKSVAAKYQEEKERPSE